jgi:hypothetical protein
MPYGPHWRDRTTRRTCGTPNGSILSGSAPKRGASRERGRAGPSKKQERARYGEPMGQVVIEPPDDGASELAHAPAPNRRRPAFIGTGHSGRGDLSERAEELLAGVQRP